MVSKFVKVSKYLEFYSINDIHDVDNLRKER